MITILFLAFVLFASMFALVDWRRGWLLAILVGILQDPVRKVTPGTPVTMIFSIVVVYAAAIFGSWPLLARAAGDFTSGYLLLYQRYQLFVLVIIVAAVNGLVNFGFSSWQVPAIALVIYFIPIPAFLMGIAYLRREEDLYRFLTYYSAITAVAMIGVPLEYVRFSSRLLGTVAYGGQDYIRHFVGIQVRILSGIYRAPDIMAWHAASLTIFALILMFRRGFPRGWFWMGMASWGFLCAMLSGRRKSIYMIAAFAIIFVGRYVRRLSVVQVISLVLSIASATVVVNHLSETRQSAVYVRGAEASQGEILDRLEGGTIETFRQFGLMGVGLGAATQGTYRFMKDPSKIWQEGGAGKFALELGLPGFIVVLLLGGTLARTMWLILRKHRGASGELLRVALVGNFVANVSSFLASHQPFSDPGLVLINAFLLGTLFSAERLADGTAAPAAHPNVRVQPARLAPQLQ